MKGLDRESILAVLEALAEAMREDEDWSMVGRHPHCQGSLRRARRYLKHPAPWGRPIANT
jgi:hypothetical protein